MFKYYIGVDIHKMPSFFTYRSSEIFLEDELPFIVCNDIKELMFNIQNQIKIPDVMNSNNGGQQI